MLVFPVVLLAVGAMIFSYTTAVRNAAVPVPVQQNEPPRIKLDKVGLSGVKLDRYRKGFDESFSSAANFSDGKLGSRIQKCAVAVLQAVLPEKSELLAPLEVTLIDEYSAVVACRAIIFATAGSDERRLKCKIKVNYLADGSCEAEYPEFFSDK